MDLQERMRRGFKPDFSEAYEEARRVIDWMFNDNAPATEQPTPIKKITENTVGTIIAIEAHTTKENVYIILGREEGCPEPNLFTREASGETGSQFWGHYRLTLKEAFTDYEERLGRGR